MESEPEELAMVGSKVLVLGAALLTLGAGALGAICVAAPPLAGTDSLLDVVNDVLAACPGALDACGDPLLYGGGGDAAGIGAMLANQQQLTPLSLGLPAGNYCGVTIDSDGDGVPDLPVQTTTQDLTVGLEAVAVVASATAACSADLATGGTFTVLDPSASPVLDCPGCDPGTSNYTLRDSLDVLRLVYGGFHHDGTTFDCNSNVRRTLVSSWSALFGSACATGTCPSGLTHAWRPGDLAPMTEAFVNLVGFGSRGIGTPPTSPVPIRRTNPLCNSLDATAARGPACAGVVPSPCGPKTACDTSGFCMPTSFGGASDYVDNDPIRRACTTGEQVCEGGVNLNPFGLAPHNGTLGLVLPIVPPDDPTVADTDAYPTRLCTVGKNSLVFTGNLHEKCPGGPTFFGDCFLADVLVVAGPGSFEYACMSKSNTHMVGTPTGLDGRAWNLPVMRNLEGGLYVRDRFGQEMNGAFYKIHTTTPAPNGTTTCAFRDPMQQIGCLVSADPCSIGFGGRQAGQQAGSQLETVNGVAPTDPNITNVVSGAGPAYPLARRLHLSTLVGFSNLAPGQLALAACLANNDLVKPSLLARGLVPLPSPGITCASYDDPPLPGCGDTPAVTNCGAPPGTQIPLITNPY
jgi:hypothetical protein